MQSVLILGGTGWVGRETVHHLIENGAEVTCLARGTSGEVPEGARLLRADRTDPRAYDGLEGEWDEVMEFAYTPDLVVPALDALADRAAHWTLVSTISVYARNDEPGADESAALVSPADLAQYPDAKVAAEIASRSRLADRLLIARPGLIVGPGDPSDRFGYWPARFTRPGPALAPVTSGRFVQVIDVSDLSAWLAQVASADVVGTVNAVGGIHPMQDALDMMADAAAFRGDLVEVADDDLLAHDVQYWAGPPLAPPVAPPPGHRARPTLRAAFPADERARPTTHEDDRPGAGRRAAARNRAGPPLWTHPHRRTRGARRGPMSEREGHPGSRRPAPAR